MPKWALGYPFGPKMAATIENAADDNEAHDDDGLTVKMAATIENASGDD